ncbi:MAG TPA: RNA 2',3'-cyclic phosphodiesterase [Thermoplasmata archaeon]|nr:RNA 2',3'-cyclic phosphodiesterase [Thermoplasmata archaeon]
MPFRAFISADLPPLPSIASFLEELRGASRDLKLVSADHLHLTLKFLGDTEDGLVPEIVSAMREASEGIPPLTVTVRGTGAFPNLSRPRVVWIGLEGAESLARIARALEENLRALGFVPESRAWSPHVTLARVRIPRGLDRVRDLLERRQDETFAQVRIEDIRLKKSVLQPQGPEYTTVESVRLSD